MEQHVGTRYDRSRYADYLQEAPTEDADQSLGHRTACAICRRVLLPARAVRPALLTIAARPAGWLGGDPFADVVGDGYGRGEQRADTYDPWRIRLPPVPSGATLARRYPAARAQQLAPRGYAVGTERGRWTGWVCALCAERLLVEEHQVGAQRALERRVASLEQRLRLSAPSQLSRRNQTPFLSSPTPPAVHGAVHGSDRQRAARGGRQHTGQMPWTVSLEEYRVVRRELRVCRQSLAEVTATLANVADDPVLAWPPLHPLRSSASPVASSAGIIDNTSLAKSGGVRAYGQLRRLDRLDIVPKSCQERVSAGVHTCATPVE